MKFSTDLIRCLFFGLFWSTLLSCQDHTSIRHILIPATSEHGTIDYGVMLPPSYKNNGQLYPVIYYLHGLNGSYSGWDAQMVAEFFTKYSQTGDIPESILIFPEGEEGFWFNHYDRDPLLEEEIIKILIPHIDDSYPADPRNRLIMGWSSGGVGAISLFSRHPGLFKAAVSLDGAILSWEEFVHFQGNRPKIVNNSDYYYENCSPHEWIVRNTNLIKNRQDTTLFLAASLFAGSHQNFIEILSDQGIPFKYKELSCNHDFSCVFSEISDELLSFLSGILD